MRRRLTSAGALVLAGALALAAACERERPGDAVGDQDRVVACDLVNRDQARAALGGEPTVEATGEAGIDALAGRSGCAWATTDGRAAALVELVRTADMAGSVRRTGFSAAARFNAARARYAEASEELVGDRAFWVDDETTLHVLVGDSYIVIEVATPDPGGPRAVARALADPAVARLREAGRQTEPDDE